ncbi:hypothetical protein JOB18_039455 [Solea senegalensis]|uniref:Uncharacterized protein n=1 Tax=Solea senegalensis TaxID=28829 RepID=A0AAV6T0Y4_SOLSE|nr:hypothetical protein JOB18_039455 [Solea senegalensis]
MMYTVEPEQTNPNYIISSFSALINTRSDNLESMVSANALKIEGLKKTVDFVCAEINDVKNKVCTLEKKMANEERRVDTCQLRVSDLERYSRRWNLRLYGVEESDKEQEGHRGKFLRKYGIHIAKAKRAEEEEVISNISLFYQRPPDDVSEENKLLLLELQNKLDELYRRKAEGAFIRSRKRWLEEGEQNSAYFFHLIKYRSKINSIHTLNVNGVITDDNKLISDFCSKFYSDLYSSKCNDEVTTQFLDSVNNVRKIDMADKDYCDTPLTIAEVSDSIARL